MLRISDLNKIPGPPDSGRANEAEALEKAAVMLQYCKDNWQDPNIRGLLFEALRHNQTLWTILRKEIQEPSNPLPQELKNNLISLSDFINRRTYEMQSWPSDEKLNILIDINKNIAAGLRGSPSD